MNANPRRRDGKFQWEQDDIMLRSNHPDWKGGNPMNLDKEGINQRVIDAMVKKPDYVKTHAKMIVCRLEDEQ
jgi:hypothetical protein